MTFDKGSLILVDYTAKVKDTEEIFDNFNLGQPNYSITKEEELRIKDKYIKFITSKKYESILFYLKSWRKDIFTEGPILREEMVSIINLLEEEIEKHN